MKSYCLCKAGRFMVHLFTSDTFAGVSIFKVARTVINGRRYFGAWLRISPRATLMIYSPISAAPPGKDARDGYSLP